MGMRSQLRRAPFGWATAAVVVALLVLVAKTAGLVVVAVLCTVERLVAVVLVLVAWCDEQTSRRAGLPPLAGSVAESGRWPR